jgi:hypothetical protein
MLRSYDRARVAAELAVSAASTWWRAIAGIERTVAPWTSDHHPGDPSGRDLHRIPDLALAIPEVTELSRIAR